MFIHSFATPPTYPFHYARFVEHLEITRTPLNHHMIPNHDPNPLSSSGNMGKSKKNVGEAQLEEDFQIQPEKVTPTLDTSNWPLLLKVYLPSLSSQPVLGLNTHERGPRGTRAFRAFSCDSCLVTSKKNVEQVSLSRAYPAILSLHPWIEFTR